MDGQTDSLLKRGLLTCHCQLLETEQGLILIDTGFGVQDVHYPHDRLSEFFLKMVSPDFREEMTAVRQIENLGYSARDVRHIILTHLDFDHAGGLDDFPEAIIHLSFQENAYALLQKTWLDRQRFRPAQWNSRARWRTYAPAVGEEWFGFRSVQRLAGLPPEILMVPLHGHTLGHTGIAVQTENGWLLNAGDAYFYHREMDIEEPYCTPGLRFYQRMMDLDHEERIQNQEKLRDLRLRHSSKEIEIFCSHDVVEFERLAGRSAGEPIESIGIRERQEMRDRLSRAG